MKRSYIDLSKTLPIVTVLYLALPNLIFTASWLHWWAAFPCTVALIVALFLFFKGYFDLVTNEEKKIVISPFHLGVIGLFAVFITILSGVGDFANQTYDYTGHHSKFRDLHHYGWPLFYKEDGVRPCYYFGFFLPIATVSYLLDIENKVRYIFIVWTSLGLAVMLIWIYVLIPFKRLLPIILYPFIGTCFVLLSALTKYLIYNEPFFIEKGHPYTKSGVVDFPLGVQFCFGLNQVIPACLVMGLSLYILYYKKNIYLVFLVIAFMFFWAPSPFLIMGLIFGILAIENPASVCLTWPSKSEWIYLTLLLLGLLPIVLYILGNSSSETTVKGWIWEFEPQWYLKWPLFIVMEVVLPYLMIRCAKIELPFNYKPLLLLCFIFKALVPLYRYGVYDELPMNGMIPLSFFINVCLVTSITKIFLQEVLIMKRLVAAFYLMACTALSFSYYMRGLMSLKQPTIANANAEFSNNYRLLKGIHSVREAKQYLCAPDCLFVKYLAKK